MPIAATDIVFYGSANMPELDTTNMGGGIDTTTKVVFTDIAATDQVTVISDNAGDTQNVAVTGRDSTGSIVTENLTLDGTNRVTGTQAFERILKIVLSSVATGTITVTRDNSATFTVIATLEPGITKVRRCFYNASSDASGGSARDFYEKIFVKNNHGSLTLTSCQIQEQSDPTTFITFNLEDTFNAAGLLGGRLNIEPSGTSHSFDSSAKYVPNSGLPAGSGLGIYLKLSLAAGTSPTKDVYVLRVTGTTT